MSSGQPLNPAGMPTTPSIRSSGVSMVSAPLNPPGVVIPPGSQGSMAGQQMMQQKGQQFFLLELVAGVNNL